MTQTKEKYKECNDKNTKLEERLKQCKDMIDGQNGRIIEKAMEHRKSRNSLMLEGLIKKSSEKINNHKVIFY